ncbi:T9SS type A sorting domain-containing protein [Hymenobacter sp. ASUV-10]|uniref:T9SS type A sorting domain-containing protein n=1 Tax=Hymenobacter aranciens TaxID=3063996 RepID=A0ABT9BCW9_9BACT|nr:T9SS type A sorting domain-containing protein [Hymenobacter sp. ASUV-10]MDO7876104.1 T9SS type A sorting domain-containing protein [Hymenobacter sp. ASUV-10]
MKHLSSAMALLGLLLGGYKVQAQDFYNNGAAITLTGGASIYIPGNLTNDNSGNITTNGSTIQVGGNVVNQNSANMNLGAAGTWEVKGNVTNTATITPGTGTLQLTGTAAQTLSTNNGQLYNLTVNNSATPTAVNVTTNVTVNNQLTLTNGMVRTTAATKVALPNGATVTGEQSGRYVAGNLEVTRNSVSGASPVSFANGASITPNNNLGNVVVTRTAGLNTANVSYGVNPTDNNKKGIDQIWTIAPATQPAGGSPATVAFSWLSDNDNGLASFTQARIWQSSGASSWIAVGPYVNANSRSISGAANSLSRFTVSNEAAPLPVELLSFTAVREGDGALLNWRTASEKNNDHFDVEVSTDGRSFTKFAVVAGQGTKAMPTDYTTTDPKLLSYHVDQVYYRLKQVDKDGKESFSPVRVLRVEVAGFTAFAFPNPMAQNGTTVQIRTAEAGPAELAVYDATGRLLMGVKTQLLVGLNEVKLAEAAKLATGAYFLKVNQGKQHTLLKLVRE